MGSDQSNSDYAKRLDEKIRMAAAQAVLDELETESDEDRLTREREHAEREARERERERIRREDAEALEYKESMEAMDGTLDYHREMHRRVLLEAKEAGMTLDQCVDKFRVSKDTIRKVWWPDGSPYGRAAQGRAASRETPQGAWALMSDAEREAVINDAGTMTYGQFVVLHYPLTERWYKKCRKTYRQRAKKKPEPN